MKYEIGDKVRVNNKDGASSRIVGKVFTVIDNEAEGSSGSRYCYKLDGTSETFCQMELDLVRRKEMVTRRTFRALKATPEYRKGALVQEACDDGDQEYVLLDEDFLTDAALSDYDDYFDGLPRYSRNTVENQPEWFEEVEMTWIAKVTRTVKKRKAKK